MAKRKPTTESAPTPTDPAAPAAEYTVLARRYRPQKFGDLVGQEPIAQVLKNAIEGQRVAHAYLFTGARGVGKTSTARILAKCLNCVNGPTVTPCDECDMCRAITSGEDVDVLEIDGASNNGVDQVRELRQNVNFRPSRSRYKIYIIDEVHMLSTAAFNALLKTLEEPPAHVKFIFATTEVHKIPITILSRCQRFDFAGIGLDLIVERLKQIVAGEHMEADDDALRLIARRAGGSMRDAQSLLDQLLSFGSKRLSAEQVNQLLGTAGEERIAALAAAVLAKDAGRALALVAAMVDQGLQLVELFDQLIEYWRDLMVVQATGQENQALSVTGSNRQALKQQAERLRPDTILAGLEVLASARWRLEKTTQGRVLIEMALVRLSRLDDLVSLAQLAQWAASREGPAVSPPPASPRQPLPASQPQLQPTTTVDPPKTPSGAEKKKEVSPAAPSAPADFTLLTEQALKDIWPQIVSESGFALANDLRRGEAAISGPNALVLRFPTGYNHSLDSGKQARLDGAVRQVFGPGVSVRVEIASSAPAAGAQDVRSLQELGSLSGRAVAGDSIGPASETLAGRTRRTQSEVVQLPLVRKVMDLFGAQVVQVDEDFAAASPASSGAAKETAAADEEMPSETVEPADED